MSTEHVTTSENEKQIDFSPTTKEFIVSFPYEQRIVHAVKESFTERYFDWGIRAWIIPAKRFSLSEIIEFSENYHFALSARATKYLREAEEQMRRNFEASKALTGSIDIPDLNGQLRKYQKAAVEYILANKQVIIGDEMGIGKTIETLAALHAADAYPVLVVCPAILKHNWQREAQKWLQGKHIQVLNGKTIETIPPADIVIVNYDILQAWLAYLQDIRFQGIIIDESHYIKNHRAQRTQCVLKLAQGIEYRLALTGTPVINRPADLISQLNALGLLEDFGGFWYFTEQYCDPKNIYGRRDISGASNLEELNRRLREIGYIRRTKEDVLSQLPPKQRSIIYVDIQDQRNKYDRTQQEVKDYIQSNINTGQYRVKKGGNFQHIFATIEAMKQAAAYAKVETIVKWTKEYLDSGEKLVLFATHLDVIDILVKNLGQTCEVVSITGKTSEKDRQEAVERFQTDPDVRLMVANIRVAGVGLTLTAASTVAFAELDWTSAAHDQAEDRCHRYGQSNVVNIYYFLANDTIDEDIYEIMEKKREIANLATNGIDSDYGNSIRDEIIQRLLERYGEKGETEDQIPE